MWLEATKMDRTALDPETFLSLRKGVDTKSHWKKNQKVRTDSSCKIYKENCYIVKAFHNCL